MDTVDKDVGYDYDDYFNEITKIKNAEDAHFWFRQRNRVITMLFEKYVDRSDRCIEVGAGTAGVAAMLKNKGYRMAVGEIHPLGVKLARDKGIDDVYQFDLMEHEFGREFDAVALFDVLEHMVDDHQAILKVSHMLQPDGKLLLSVPAHRWLWCKDDEVSGHFRRYEQRCLKELLKLSGFKILFAKNYFTLILPLLWLRARTNYYKDELVIHPVANFICSQLCAVEQFAYNRLGFDSSLGGSIFVVAQKEQ